MSLRGWQFRYEVWQPSRHRRVAWLVTDRLATDEVNSEASASAQFDARIIFSPCLLPTAAAAHAGDPNCNKIPTP